jgi:RNA-dependent RNA polymerase
LDSSLINVIFSKFLLHPGLNESMNEDLKLWIRESQLKVLHGPDNSIQDDISQLTMDLIRTAHLKRPARLSKEVMTCLSQGGVNTDAIQNLFEAGLKAEYEALTSWEGEGAIIKLWDTVCSSGSVLYARLRREAVGASRAYGFGQAHNDDNTRDNFDEDSLSEPSMPWTPDLISGFPSSLEESTLAFLVSGFDPISCTVLRQKIKALLNIAIDQYVARYHVGVPLSVEGFAVPG